MELKNPYSISFVEGSNYLSEVEEFHLGMEQSSIFLEEKMKHNALQEAQSIAFAMQMDCTVIC